MKKIIVGSLLLILLTGCAELRQTFKPSISSAEAFMTAGFTKDQAEWLAEGFEAHNVTVTPLKALEYKNEYYSIPQKSEVINDWIKYDFAFDEAGTWSEQGFSPLEASAWKNNGYAPGMAAQKRDEQLQSARDAEQGEWEKTVMQLKALGYTTEGEQSNDALMKNNPYTVKGKCFYLRDLECRQLHDRHSGLYIVGWKNYVPQMAALQFKPGDAIAKNVRFTCRAIVSGTLEYTSVAGSLEVVPILKVVAVYH